MILQLLFSLIYYVVAGFFHIFGIEVGVVTLPFGLDPILVTAMQYVYAFIEIFPPVGVVLQAFLIYLGFRIVLIVLRLFIGARAIQT